MAPSGGTSDPASALRWLARLGIDLPMERGSWDILESLRTYRGRNGNGDYAVHDLLKFLKRMGKGYN